MAIARQVGDVHLLGEVLSGLSMGTSEEDHWRAHEEALECFRAAGDDLGAAGELHALSVLDFQAGRLEEGRARLQEALAIAEGLGDEMFLYLFRSDLAEVLLWEGRYEDAAPVVRCCLLVARRIGLGLDIAELLFAAACCTAWQADHLRAARLHGAADAAIDASVAIRRIKWVEVEQRLREREQGRLRALIGDVAFEQAYDVGARLSRAQALELALGREPPGQEAAA